ncbi:hypothetical protein DAEQUDRAFT_809620 [Daedalea quercina L-15889]|uniref:Uncharacterized protein n=1 Tax=Daedalea quercina L-15889 TaxID=1314783 RepID=A0A165SI73_9APHY|nr:hypothetical protein DAEQUDRAFT_809620 [Daedalea quercina L-15889]
MLALCMTVVESVILDAVLKLDKASEFKAVNAPMYREHLIKLADFRRQKPNRYHRVMHNLFKATTWELSLAGNSSANMGGDSFDWSSIPNE